MGLADLWNGDKKVEANALKAQMIRENREHLEKLERRDAANSKTVEELKNREEKLQEQRNLEREDAARRNNELREVQARNAELHNQQYAAVGKDNKDRLAKLHETNEKILSQERIREGDEKQRLAERNVKENVRMEDRQKEVEADLNQRVKEGENERKELNELKMKESHSYSKHIDEVNSKHGEELKRLKEEQNQAALEGDKNAVYFEKRDAIIDGMVANTKTCLLTAYEKDVQARSKRVIMQTIRSEAENLLTLGTKLKANIEVAKENDTPAKILIITIKKLIQKCETSANSLSGDLSAGSLINPTDEKRKELVGEAKNLALDIISIISKWNAGMVEELDPSDFVDNLEKYEELFDLVKQLDEKIREIPMPEANEEDFNAVIARSTAALVSGASIENSVQQRYQDGKPEEQKAINN